jgi:hypothetical protein
MDYISTYKEQTADKLVTVIKDKFYVNMGKQLVMKWKEAEDKGSEQSASSVAGSSRYQGEKKCKQRN